jgi:RND superfamily putative drug exporter
MRLMGKWNWWAPGILGRFVDRLGFSHVEEDQDDGSPPGIAKDPIPTGLA